ncbi:hypothetical protein C8R44DRAFT_753427 [Mycena epipterygia]|nr:hypothetical protein C8R44DRAFT_753427 [Mycena epipterygia]
MSSSAKACRSLKTLPRLPTSPFDRKIHHRRPAMSGSKAPVGSATESTPAAAHPASLTDEFVDRVWVDLLFVARAKRLRWPPPMGKSGSTGWFCPWLCPLSIALITQYIAQSCTASRAAMAAAAHPASLADGEFVDPVWVGLLAVARAKRFALAAADGEVGEHWFVDTRAYDSYLAKRATKRSAWNAYQKLCQNK